MPSISPDDVPDAGSALAGVTAIRTMSTAAAGPSRDELLDALQAVHEAIDIPHAATVSGDEVRTQILTERCGHAAAMLGALLAEDSWADWAWSVAYLRARVGEHPAAGYKTWEERMAELEAARHASPEDVR